MKKFLECFAWILIAAGVIVAAIEAGKGPELRMTWRRAVMDGSRTGVQGVTPSNQDTALGSFEDDGYVAPNGTVFKNGSTPEVAALLSEVQPKMAGLKARVGYCPEEMVAKGPESGLSNMLVDQLRLEGERLWKVPMDFALCNFGGIRCSMPQGDVMLDDILSMFPFRNSVVYAKVRGAKLRELFEFLAATKIQCISGARIVVKDHKLVSAEIGGKPIDDKKLYNVTTIDFLLGGGDRIAIGAMAEDVKLSTVLIKDFMLRYFDKLQAEGKPIEYSKDGRVTILED